MADLSGSNENPYAPPEDSVEAEPAVHHRESACKWFRAMAWFVWLYPAMSAAASLFIFIVKGKGRTPDFETLLVQSVVMGLVAIFVVWISIRLRRNFDKTYKLARWTAVLGGAFFFPVLTIPAFMAVSHMEKYRRSQSETPS